MESNNESSFQPLASCADAIEFFEIPRGAEYSDQELRIAIQELESGRIQAQVGAILDFSRRSDND